MARDRVLSVALLLQLAGCTSLADEGELGAGPAGAPTSVDGTEAALDTLGSPGIGGSFNPGNSPVSNAATPEGPPVSAGIGLDPGSKVLAPDAAPPEPEALAPLADAGSTPPPRPGVCPGGASLGGRCYRAATAPLPWNEARAACLASGGDLASIGSAEEDALVGGLVNESVWLGASDQQVDNFFQWVDGSPVSFTNWGPGQPDAFPGQDCVQKREEPGEPWYDQPCSSVLSYVCESLILS